MSAAKLILYRDLEDVADAKLMQHLAERQQAERTLIDDASSIDGARLRMQSSTTTHAAATAAAPLEPLFFPTQRSAPAPPSLPTWAEIAQDLAILQQEGGDDVALQPPLDDSTSDELDSSDSSMLVSTFEDVLELEKLGITLKKELRLLGDASATARLEFDSAEKLAAEFAPAIEKGAVENASSSASGNTDEEAIDDDASSAADDMP